MFVYLIFCDPRLIVLRLSESAYLEKMNLLTKDKIEEKSKKEIEKTSPNSHERLISSSSIVTEASKDEKNFPSRTRQARRRNGTNAQLRVGIGTWDATPLIHRLFKKAPSL